MLEVVSGDGCMSDRGDRRIVYSTAAGRICAACGWPARDCRCSTSTATEPIPTRIVATLRLETRGRGGKCVTVVDGLPRNARFLRALSQELKRACGTGGTAVAAGVELQGDMRTRVRERLLSRGFVVKG